MRVIILYFSFCTLLMTQIHLSVYFFDAPDVCCFFFFALPKININFFVKLHWTPVPPFTAHPQRKTKRNVWEAKNKCGLVLKVVPPIQKAKFLWIFYVKPTIMGIGGKVQCSLNGLHVQIYPLGFFFASE